MLLKQFALESLLSLLVRGYESCLFWIDFEA